MKTIKESLGRDYRAIRAAVDVGTRNHRGDRDGGLASKWLGLGLVTLIILVRTFAPLFGVLDANLPGMETLLGALSLTFGVEGFYLFRRSYDMRREDKTGMSAQPAPAPLPPFIIRGNELHPDEPGEDDEVDEAIERAALEQEAQRAAEAERLKAEKAKKKQARADARAGIRSRLTARLKRNKTTQTPPAAQAETPEPRPSGAPPQPSKSNDSTPGVLHRQASVEEGAASHPSGAPAPSSAPSGAAPLTQMIPPLPRLPSHVERAPVMFPPEDDGLGDLDDDPEQLGDDEDRETGAAPGRSAMGGFDFEADDFDNSFAPFADDPRGGVEGFETESDEDVEQPRNVPRGRPRGARGRASDKAPR